MADRICKAQTRPWSIQDPACDFKTVWPSGLRRWLKAPVRKGVGLNPTAVVCGLPCATKVPTCPVSRGYGECRREQREQPTTKSRVTQTVMHTHTHIRTHPHTPTHNKLVDQEVTEITTAPNGFRVHLLSHSDTLSC